MAKIALKIVFKLKRFSHNTRLDHNDIVTMNSLFFCNLFGGSSARISEDFVGGKVSFSHRGLDTERTADAVYRPESSLTNPPGHLWRDKWTALNGPLPDAFYVVAHPEQAPSPYRGTSLIRKRTPPGPYRRPMRRPIPRVLCGWAFSYGRSTPVHEAEDSNTKDGSHAA